MTIFLWLLKLVVAYTHAHTHTFALLCIARMLLRYQHIPRHSVSTSIQYCLVVSVPSASWRRAAPPTLAPTETATHSRVSERLTSLLLAVL